MDINTFMIGQDIITIREIMGLTQEEFAKELGIDPSTEKRWESKDIIISDRSIEKIYSFAYKHDIKLNVIKEHLYIEEYHANHQVVLFHGAKGQIEGALRIDQSRMNNDFGQGFYCGTSLEQSALFVSHFAQSSIYIMKFMTDHLNFKQYKVDQEWMLTIAYYRGKLDEYKHTKKVKSIIKQVEEVDVIIAPIADNRMFQIIDSFIEGDITDEQCKHCLAATNLGYQYVFKTEKAIKQAMILERCYLCQSEREQYMNKRLGDTKISEDKIKIAKRQYRGKGQYIDEIMI